MINCRPLFYLMLTTPVVIITNPQAASGRVEVPAGTVGAAVVELKESWFVDFGDKAFAVSKDKQGSGWVKVTNVVAAVVN